MAAVLDSVPNFWTISSPASPRASLSFTSVRFPRIGRNSTRGRSNGGACRAMVQQTAPGASAIYAKEMERLSAKESLLLAFKDLGGFEALVSGKATDLELIDVNERITSLERLNPAPRPTTSPFLEGRWNMQWFGGSNRGLASVKFLSQRFPTSIATLLELDVLVKDGYTKATAKLKFLNLVESKVILTSKLSVEGPLRMKEVYVEGVIETPTVSEQAIPQQLKGTFGQAVSTLQQLPAPVKDAVSNGIKIPLNGTFERLFMISYLDEEILIIRDTSGVAEVLTRVEGAPPAVTADPDSTRWLAVIFPTVYCGSSVMSYIIYNWNVNVHQLFSCLPELTRKHERVSVLCEFCIVYFAAKETRWGSKFSSGFELDSQMSKFTTEEDVIAKAAVYLAR